MIDGSGIGNGPNPAPVLYSPKGPRLGVWSLAASLVALVIGANGCEVSWPPTSNPIWLVMAFVVPAVLGLALAASRSSAIRWDRGMAGLAILVGLLAGAPSLQGYFGNTFTYPWWLLGPLALFVALGCVYARQFVVLAALAAFTVLWLGPALTSPGNPLPRTLLADGLTLTLKPAFGEGPTYIRNYYVQVAEPPGQDLTKTFDLDRIEVRADAGDLIPIKCWPLFPVDPEEGLGLYALKAFVPDWVRSWNLRIKVRELGTRGVASIEIGLPHDGQAPQPARSVSSPPYSLSVSDLKWGQSTTQYPPKRVLTATVTFTGFPYSGTEGSEVRVLDSSGRLVRMRSGSTEGNESGATQRVEMDGVTGGRLRFELVPEDAPSERAAQFHFDALPGRP